MRTLNHPTRRLTNGYPIIDLNRRWHFIITLNLSDRRHSNSDHAAPAQLYRGNLPHYHWLGRRVPPVAAAALHRGSLQRRASLKTPAANRGRSGRSPFPSARRKARREPESGQAELLTAPSAQGLIFSAVKGA